MQSSILSAAQEKVPVQLDDLPHWLSPECCLQIFHHLIPHFHFLLIKGEQGLHLQKLVRNEMKMEFSGNTAD